MKVETKVIHTSEMTAGTSFLGLNQVGGSGNYIDVSETIYLAWNKQNVIFGLPFGFAAQEYDEQRTGIQEVASSIIASKIRQDITAGR